MKINKNKFYSHKKKFCKFSLLLENFFENKLYLKKGFLNKFINDAKQYINIDKKRAYYLLKEYHKNKFYIEKIHKLIFTIDKEIKIEQSGGFFYNKYDNKFIRMLSTVDFVLDLIALIPNSIITNNNNNIKFPYGIISLMINLLRGDYDFAFYSFLSLIPGVGSIIASTSKMIERIIRYAYNRTENDDIEEYYKQIQAVRRVHDFVKDENYDKLDNPYSDNFENSYNLYEIDQLYLK